MKKVRPVDLAKTAKSPAEALDIKCPQCGQATKWHGNLFRPFCSERCQQIDLGAWADNRYVVVGDPAGPEEDV